MNESKTQGVKQLGYGRTRTSHVSRLQPSISTPLSSATVVDGRCTQCCLQYAACCPTSETVGTMKRTCAQSSQVRSIHCSMLRAASVQRVPGALGDAHEAANRLVVREADGQLAPVAEKSLEQFALTCNHMVQAIRAAMAELECDRKEIAPSGCISRAFLEEKDKTFSQLFAQ